MKNRIIVFTALLILAACYVRATALPCGTVLATYRGIDAKSNGADQGKLDSCAGRGIDGLQYQCVEYVKRFYSQAISMNTSGWHLNAVDYYGNAQGLGLTSFPNGGSTAPAPDDIIVFRKTGTLGHVAIVTGVSPGSITCIEQNWSSTGTVTLQLTQLGDSYTVQPRGSYQVLGWLRHASTGNIVYADPKDIWTTSLYSYATCSGSHPGGGKNDDRLRVGGWGDLYYSLLQFDLTGQPANVHSAVLYLYCFSQSGGGTPMYLDRITQFWDWRTQGTGCDRLRLWWADRPSAAQWIPGQIPNPTVGQWYSVDITGLFNAWQSGMPNYGLQLRPVNNFNNNFDEFYSADYSGDPSLRPKLVIQP